MNFDILPNFLVEPFFVSMSMGDSVVAKRVYGSCPVLLSKIVTLVDMVELGMLDFDVIFVWLGYMILFLQLISEQG